MNKTTALLAALALGAGSLQATSIVNGEFDDRLWGWDFFLPTDESQFGAQIVPAGVIRIGPSYDPPEYYDADLVPHNGSYLIVGTGDIYSVRGGEKNITVSQSVQLDKGDILSGWSAFYNGDFELQDSAWVRISSGAQTNTLWHESSGYIATGASVDYDGTTPWTHWQWTAPLEDIYTVTLGATTFGDNAFSSVGFHDSIEVLYARVPETGGWVCLLIGVLSLFGFKFKTQEV